MAYMMAFLTRRWCWLALAVLGVALLAVALYYQHVVGDEPCQICIHVRIWVSALALLGIVMSLLPPAASVYLVGNLLLLAGVIGLTERSWYLYQLENGHGSGSCEFYLGFPDWFALDVWFPPVFEVRNLCGYTPEILLGISMAEGLLMVSGGLLLACLLALYANAQRLRG